MSGFIFVPSQPGLRKIIREHEELALRYLWYEKSSGATTREVWIAVNEKLGEGKSKSRATIINFLVAMAEEEVLGVREETGKGGYHGVYTPKLDEQEYVKYVVRTVYDSLMRDFPEETREVLDDLGLIQS